MSDSLSGLTVRGVARPMSAADRCLDLMAQLGGDVSVTRAAPDLASLGTLASGCDVFVVDSDVVPPSELGVLAGELTGLAGRGVVAAVFSPYGATGPLAGQRGSELTVQAMSGIMSTNGYPSDPPLMTGVPATACAAALLGLAAIVSVVSGRRTGQSPAGELIDVSQFDVGFCLLGTLLPHVFLTGEPPPRIGNRHPMSAPWNTYPTSDGWVVITTIGEPIWRSLAALADPELLTDQRYADAGSRVRQGDELDARISAWTKGRTTAEVLAAAGAAGVPAGDIRTLRQALASAIAEGRPVVRRAGSRLTPGLPVRIEPAGGEQVRPLAPSTPSDAHETPGAPGPLAGVRVLELSTLTSAPLAGRFLGALGADVLKVEPPAGEMSRHLAQQVDGVGYLYYVNNTDKRGCVLDLRQAGDIEALWNLIADTDVFLTNLAPSSLRRLGLSAADVHARFPSVVYCGVSGYGAAGERGGQDKAFDTVIQAQSGIMALTGRPDGPPTKTGMSFADVLGACVATAGVVVGLRARNRGDRGQVVDVAMLDAALWTAQERWDAALADETARLRSGNRCAGRPAHDIYACRDGLVAVDAVDGDGWERLARVLGRSGDPRDAHDVLTAAAADSTAAEIAATASRAGVCAAPVLDLAAVTAHPHVRDRELIVDQQVPAAQRATAPRPIRVLGTPVKFTRAAVGVRKPAPPLAAQPPRWNE